MVWSDITLLHEVVTLIYWDVRFTRGKGVDEVIFHVWVNISAALRQCLRGGIFSNLMLFLRRVVFISYDNCLSMVWSFWV